MDERPGERYDYHLRLHLSLNGWTGGQFSAWRAAMGIAIAWGALSRLAHAPAVVDAIALAAGGALAIGWRAREWAIALAAALIARSFNSGTWASSAPALVALLLLALAPRAPYGSWDARGRVDAGGGWRLPRWNHWTARAAALAALALVAAGQARPLDALWPVLLALDPAWLPPQRARRQEHLLYDGTCGLCHRFVRFVLAEDRRAAFRFAPLAGATSAARITGERADLPDSVVVLADDGRLLVRSRAVFHTLGRLGGLWRALAGVLELVPRPIADFAYDRVAAVRHRLFARPQDACPMAPAALAERFDP